MSQTEPIKFADRNDEAMKYLESHKINDLLNNITAHLVYNQTDTPKETIIDYLERLKKAKLANLNPPSLIEDNNLQSIFGMLDPSGKGSITYKQYCEALKTLGIQQFEMNPEGKKDDRIKMDVFMKEAKKGLIKINATYMPK